MSWPKKVRLFKPWAEAMVQGAEVKDPDYGKKRSRSTSKGKTPRKRSKSSRRRKRKTKKNA